MSFDIYIGEASIKPNPDDAESMQCVIQYGERSLNVIVYPLEHPDAPAFEHDELSAHKNSRHPSYSGWDNFTRLAGLYELFFAEGIGLMASHPGTVIVTRTDLEIVRLALLRWQQRYPAATPRFEAATEDATLARLLWLEWWMNWALENCRIPALHNH